MQANNLNINSPNVRTLRNNRDYRVPTAESDICSPNQDSLLTDFLSFDHSFDSIISVGNSTANSTINTTASNVSTVVDSLVNSLNNLSVDKSMIEQAWQINATAQNGKKKSGF